MKPHAKESPQAKGNASSAGQVGRRSAASRKARDSGSPATQSERNRRLASSSGTSQFNADTA